MANDTITEILSSREAVEVEGYLRACKEVWFLSTSQEDLWLRLDEKGSVGMGIRLVREEEDPDKVFLIGVTLSWSLPKVKEHVEDILTNNTSRAIRREIVDLACNLGVPKEVADTLARTLLKFKSNGSISERIEGDLKLFHLVGGGWIQLRLIQGLIHIVLSVPMADGGYGSVLSGIVAPGHEHSRDTAAGIAGWEGEEQKNG
jgi:hypothetical protein